MNKKKEITDHVAKQEPETMIEGKVQDSNETTLNRTGRQSGKGPISPLMKRERTMMKWEEMDRKTKQIKETEEAQSMMMMMMMMREREKKRISC